jgi:hypothetical protein
MPASCYLKQAEVRNMIGRGFCEQAWGARNMIIGTVLLLLVSCNGMEAPSCWVDSRITADGNIDDWRGVPALVLEEQEASLRIANDSTSLYLLLQLRNRRLAGLIHLSGLTLCLNSKGNKDKQFVLRYRGGPEFADMQAAGFADSLPRRRLERGTGPRFDTLESFTCRIEDRIAEKEIPTDGGQGPAVGSGISDGILVYEFSVPLRESEVLSYGLGVGPGQTVGVGLTWGGFDREEMRRNLGGMGGPGGGGRGGGGRGGTPPGGGPRGGGPRPSQQLPSKQEVWFKTSLVENSEEQLQEP